MKLIEYFINYIDIDLFSSSELVLSYLENEVINPLISLGTSIEMKQLNKKSFGVSDLVRILCVSIHNKTNPSIEDKLSFIEELRNESNSLNKSRFKLISDIISYQSNPSKKKYKDLINRINKYRFRTLESLKVDGI